MASETCTLLLVVVSFAFLQMTMAGDADISSDFLVPANTTTVDGSFFTYNIYKGTHTLVMTEPRKDFAVMKVSMAEFPALDGQSLSLSVLIFPAGTANSPHIHPRSAELLFLTQGSLDVGFIDTENELYTQTLQMGDFFVFPKGLVHFQNNVNSTESAMAVSTFGSADAGTISLPNTLFDSGINDAVLAKSFETDHKTIEALKKGVAAKP